MSWEINKNTSAITMHKGDTGAYYATLSRKSGSAFVDGDVAIYEVKSGSTVMIHREFNLQPAVANNIELGNGKFLIAFRNSDTDTWAAGTYNTEIRVALNPKRNKRVAVFIVSEEATPFTATVNVDTCLAYVEGDSGTVTLTYTSSWSADPTNYGITITGTPVSGDKIVVMWNKNADDAVVDGDVVRTIRETKSTITITDVLIQI